MWRSPLWALIMLMTLFNSTFTKIGKIGLELLIQLSWTLSKDKTKASHLINSIKCEPDNYKCSPEKL